MLQKNRQIDPINLLRQFKIEKKPIKLKDQYLYFDNIRLPLKTETAWVSKKSNRQYDLGTLWLRLEHDEKNTQFKQYYKEATELGLQSVSNVDRDEISNYFNGVINYTEDIDNELKQKMSQEIKPKNEKISLLEKYVRRDPNGFSEQQKPLIVVPQIKYPGNINLLNVQKFLMEGQYEEPANRLITVQKYEIKYEINHYLVNFEIIENPKDQWKNVVAVFLSGQKNEIKNWPDSDQPAILFSKILGFYMKYHDMPVPEDVSKLNVNVLNVNRNKRFQDMLLQKEFWDKLTKFMIQKRNIN